MGVCMYVFVCVECEVHGLVMAGLRAAGIGTLLGGALNVTISVTNQYFFTMRAFNIKDNKGQFWMKRLIRQSVHPQ
jgi:hypothetical protein